VAISYRDSRRDSRRTEGKRVGLGPLLVAIAAVAGLIVLAPETTAAVENAVASMIALPRF
jgi:hypothetical protein